MDQQATGFFEFACHDLGRISIDGLCQVRLGLRSVYGRVGGWIDQDIWFDGLDEISNGCWLGEVAVGGANGDKLAVGRGKVTSQLIPNLAILAREQNLQMQPRWLGRLIELM
jgi:hypothetical protein